MYNLWIYFLNYDFYVCYFLNKRFNFFLLDGKRGKNMRIEIGICVVLFILL